MRLRPNATSLVALAAVVMLGAACAPVAPARRTLAPDGVRPSPRGDLMLVTIPTPGSEPVTALIDLEGRVMRGLGDGVSLHEHAWAPDGQSLTFLRIGKRDARGFPAWRLMLHDVASGAEVELSADASELLGFSPDGLSVWWSEGDQFLNPTAWRFVEFDTRTGGRHVRAAPPGDFFTPRLLASGEIMGRAHDTEHATGAPRFWSPLSGALEDWPLPAGAVAVESIQGGRALLIIQRIARGARNDHRLIVVDRRSRSQRELLSTERLGWSVPSGLEARVELVPIDHSTRWFGLAIRVKAASRWTWIIDAEEGRVIDMATLAPAKGANSHWARLSPRGDHLLACWRDANRPEPRGVVQCAISAARAGDVSVDRSVRVADASEVTWLTSDLLLVARPDESVDQGARWGVLDIATGIERRLEIAAP